MLGVAGTVGVAGAQVSSADRTCIATFNKAVRNVGKAQGKIAAKCLQRFASGGSVDHGGDVSRHRRVRAARAQDRRRASQGVDRLR